MTESATLCIGCARLRGCPLLVDFSNKFAEELLITEKKPRVCDEWDEASPREVEGRKRAYAIGGNGSLRAIHRFSQVGEEEYMDQVPDFQGMLRDGITIAERQEQLRFETNEAGETVFDSSSNPTPRSVFPLRKYAADPDGPIKKPARSIMFESTEALINLIVKSEVDQGLVQKNKAKKPGAPAEKEETHTMNEPQKKTIQVVRRPPAGAPAAAATKGKAPNGTNGKTAAAASAGKVATVATNKKRLGVPSKAVDDTAAETPKTAAPAAGAKVDLSPVLKALEALKKELKEVKAAQAASDARHSDGLTILHDVLMQRLNNNLIQVHKLLANEEAEVPQDANENSLLGAETPLNIFSYVDAGEAPADNEEVAEDEEEGNED